MSVIDDLATWDRTTPFCVDTACNRSFYLCVMHYADDSAYRIRMQREPDARWLRFQIPVDSAAYPLVAGLFTADDATRLPPFAFLDLLVEALESEGDYTLTEYLKGV